LYRSLRWHVEGVKGKETAKLIAELTLCGRHVPCALCLLSCLRVQQEPEAAAALEVDPEPFSYRPLPSSEHVYEMVDGVVRVWPDTQARWVGMLALAWHGDC
jgi:hypothetical protein